MYSILTLQKIVSSNENNFQENEISRAYYKKEKKL